MPIGPEVAEAFPPGTIMPYLGATAPAGWFLCDGAAYSRTTYAALFAVIGGQYGTGDGTTFNMPDLQGRVPIMVGTQSLIDTRGKNEGVALANRRPQHRHNPHRHATGTSGGALSNGGFSAPYGGFLDWYTGLVDGGSGNVNDALDGPAYLVVNYIIKA